MNYIEEEFEKRFGVPVGHGQLVMLTEGSDTMLVSRKDILEFSAEVDRRAREEVVKEITSGLNIVKFNGTEGYNPDEIKEKRQQLKDNQQGV